MALYPSTLKQVSERESTKADKLRQTKELWKMRVFHGSLPLQTMALYPSNALQTMALYPYYR